NYSVALINGEPLGQNGFPTDPNAAKDVAGHIGAQAQASEKFGLSGGVSFYTGTGFSPGKLATKDSITWVDLNNNNIIDNGEIQGVAATAAVASQNFARWAVGVDAGAVLETGLGVGRFGIEAIAASNLDRTVMPSDPVLAGVDSRQLSLTANLTQQIGKYAIVGVRGAYYDPNSDLFENRAGQIVPATQTYWVVSPVAGLTLDHGRIVAQYDFVIDKLGRDQQGVPTDAANDQFTVRLQVDL
ncbi:MAG TPA: hypothetical protein VLC09_00435, partial [Polyangiaceae bacterium]|nr:hypothetical protein [Polyangiaceae bacterium]